jgi:hypothetical protein
MMWGLIIRDALGQVVRRSDETASRFRIRGWMGGVRAIIPPQSERAGNSVNPSSRGGSGLSWGIMLNSGIVGVNVNAPGYYPGNIRAEPHGA